MKKFSCAVLALVMLLSIVVLPASATEVEKPTEDELRGIFSDIGFAATMVGNLWCTDGLGQEPEKVPDITAFWYLSLSGALNEYYAEDEYGDGWYKLTYDEYIAVVDAKFTNHSDMKQYLTDGNYYDPATGKVEIFIGGLGGPSDWVLTSTYETGNSIYLQGLYLEDVAEDEDLVEYYDWHYSNYGDKFLIQYPILVKLDKTDAGWKIDMCREFDWYICEEKNLLFSADGDSFTPYAPLTLNIEKGATVTMYDEPLYTTGFMYNNQSWYSYGQGFFLNIKVADTHELTGVYLEDATGKTPLEYVEDTGLYCGFPNVGKPLTLHVETKPIVTANTPDVELKSHSNVSIIAPAASTDYYENLELVVSEIKPSNSNYSTIQTAMGDSYEKFVPLDISLEDYKGDKTQPNGKITVSIPLPEGWDTKNIEVVHVADNGVKTVMPSKISANSEYVLFETDHFSAYVLTKTKQTTTNNQAPTTPPTNSPTTSPKTGDNSNIALWVALLTVSTLGLAYVTVLSSKKKYNR